MKKNLIPWLALAILSLTSCGGNTTSLSSLLSSNGGSASSNASSTPSSQSRDLDGYNLVWSDEFDGTELDTSYWSYDLGASGWGNQELEYYNQDNAVVENGVLTITGKKETYRNANYTSSRIKTVGKAYTTYGRIEARIKLSAQNAMWPAFWMMPEENTSWPYSGEIDIMENKGSDAYTTTSALHYLNGNQQGDYQVGGYAFSQRNKEGTIEDWHTYYVVWDADEFNFYVDDHLKLTVPKRTWHPAGGKAYTSDDDFPFNKNFYVILNLAIGGTFDGGREPDADFVSAEMQVDYVRMYQFK